MAIGSEEIKKEIKGDFIKFRFMVTVTRNNRNEHYKPFFQSDATSFYYTSFAYARSLDDMLFMMLAWERQDSAFKYKLISEDNRKRMKVEEIIEDFYKENGTKYLIRHTFINGCYEIIH